MALYIDVIVFWSTTFEGDSIPFELGLLLIGLLASHHHCFQNSSKVLQVSTVVIGVPLMVKMVSLITILFLSQSVRSCLIVVHILHHSDCMFYSYRALEYSTIIASW
jgi:hypothetical protein